MLFHKFFDFFEGYEDCYVIIGGNAAAIWLAQDHQDFRATQDYDMVVRTCLESFQEYSQEG